MSGDPYWTTARFRSSCSKCQSAIPKGDRIFYYPRIRTVLCGGEDCGADASRDFSSHAADETFCSM